MTHYYEGGLAEVVNNPSRLTFTYFENWFKGNTSIGIAMKLLGLPYTPINVSVFEMDDDELVVNLINEEKILYSNTIFQYRNQINKYKTPELRVSVLKLLRPGCLINTTKMLFTQAKWIANPSFCVSLANELCNTIPNQNDKDPDTINKILEVSVWPHVIAIGLLNEFFSLSLLHGRKPHIQIQINTYIDKKVANRDWLYQSIHDQQKVKNGDMKFKEYLQKYGKRADKDYEITCPRWYETPREIQKRIHSFSSKQKETSETPVPFVESQLLETVINLRIIRSEAKRKALIHFDALRQSILQKIENGNSKPKLNKEFQYKIDQNAHKKGGTSGIGKMVSAGTASGTAIYISNSSQIIPKNTIGVFPNASPEFTHQFPLCVGIIFQKGGITSHGAIVAREFAIPAIVVSDNVIQNGASISINGNTGEWSTT